MKMFRSLLSVIMAVVMAVSLAAVSVSAEEAALNYTNITLTKGYQTTLAVKGGSGSVAWSSEDSSIASVNSKGDVVGKAAGTTNICAKTGGTTLKCKVTVVVAKINLSESNVTLSKKGDTKIVTIEVKGEKSGLTVGTSNRSVVSASWVTPVKWDGNKISFMLTANSTGTATINVYLKNYASTIYKKINVNVGNVPSAGNSSTAKNVTILPGETDIKINTGDRTELSVYSTYHSDVVFALSDPTVATVSAGKVNGYWRNFTITGNKSGTTTLRFANKNNANSYVDVKITVSNEEYYVLYTVMPTVKPLATDKIIKVNPTNSSVTYYMIVPENYDPAYANTVIAKKLNTYVYGSVYTEAPYNSSSNGTFYPFINANSKYNYGYRYVFLPKDYSKVDLDTVIAAYNEKYDYWTVYSQKPPVTNRYDQVVAWDVGDPRSGRTETHYLLVPYYGYDSDRINKIKSDDIAQNSTYEHYVGYDFLPSVDYSKDSIVSYSKNGNRKYMAVPQNDTIAGLVKANEAVLKDTGIFEYNVIYSTYPTANADSEYVATFIDGSARYYVLLKKDTTQESNVNYYKTYANGIKDD